jgi:DNA topoisomerase-1
MVRIAVQKGDEVMAARVAPLQHRTKPPGRLTEGTLVKAMEENGIGRPSTYAPIIRVLQVRMLL